ncbi:MAG: hypothetical protein K8U03_06560 [Planctomycetia bacterium]|nr:hypothetical protein [Planctomycetia bacterium]
MSDSDAHSESEQFAWRDTYFVWFMAARRPTLKQLQTTLAALPDHYALEHPEADEMGNIESITVLSTMDRAALEISYLAGDDIHEQAETSAEEMKSAGDSDPKRLHRLAMCNARFEVMQFERVDESNMGDEDDEELGEGFDPSMLLIVVNALTKLVDGIGVDPQSGLIV